MQAITVLPARAQTLPCAPRGEWPRTAILPAVDVIRFEGAEVSRNFLVRHRGSFIEEGFSHMPLRARQAPGIYPELDDPDDGVLQEIGPAALLCGGPHGADSYFHWLIDYVPRIWALEQAGAPKLPMIVNLDMVPVQRETLAIYAPSGSTIAKSPRARWRCPELWASSFLTKTGIVPPEVVQFLRRALDRVDGKGYGEKIYLSRRGIPSRALAEEPEIERRLAESGFRVLVPHQLRFADQIRALRAARVVVVPHGGSMASIVFAPPGCVVIEIATKPLHTFGPSLCAAAGHRFRRIYPGPDLIADLMKEIADA